MSTNYSKDQVKEILLDKNKAIIIKTDTVYGILSLSTNTIEKIKLREPGKKKIIKLIGDVSKLGTLPNNLLEITKRFWPGPLTIIYKGNGYRIPNNKFLLEILSEIDYIYASSANITNNKTITTLEEAKKIFNNKNVFFVENKSSEKISNIASTVFDYDNLKIIREGTIKEKEILNLVQKS